jgi:mRNA interferase MazF
MGTPERGEIWLADLDPTRGHEQAGRRPVLVLSVDTFNQGPAKLVFAVPITSRLRAIPTHILIRAPEGGTKADCAILCEALRSISKERLIQRLGRVSPATLLTVEDRIRILLGL